MKLTNKTALSIYNRLKVAELVESIDDYPESQRDGRDDLQFLADEISYFRSMFEEDNTIFKESLDNARALLRETKNGKVIPLDPKTFQPKRGYKPYNIEDAKYVVAQYKQLQYYEKRLKDMGYYGSY